MAAMLAGFTIAATHPHGLGASKADGLQAPPATSVPAQEGGRGLQFTEPSPLDFTDHDGYVSLFDGKTLDGWMTSSEKTSKTPVEDGCVNPHKCGGYMMVHKEMWGNYVFSCEIGRAHV